MLRKAGKECGSIKAHGEQEREGRELVAAQPPETPIYTFVKISKEGVSLPALNWNITGPLPGLCHSFLRGAAETLELLLCARHCSRCWSHREEQNRARESLLSWSLTYIHNFLSLEMIL